MGIMETITRAQAVKAYTGYSCIGLFNPKGPEHVGAVMRAAGCYGVNTVFYVSVATPNEGGDGLIGAEFFSLDAGGVATPLGFSEAFFGGMAFSYLVPVELQSFSIE